MDSSSTPKSFQTTKIENNNPTEDWVANQSELTSPLNDQNSQQPLESTLSQPVTPLIPVPPLRGFKPSRKSVDAQSPHVMDQDDTVRGLDGFRSRRPVNGDQEEQSSDDSDLFLKLAREESTMNSRSGIIKRSQITDTNRQSLPSSHGAFQSTVLRRRGSDQESTTGSRYGDDQMAQALTYRPSAGESVSKEIMPIAFDLTRTRFQAGAPATPITPRASTSRDISPEAQSHVPYAGRRPSVQDHMIPSPRTNSHRQSTLSYSNPRTYNSSPLVTRTAADNIQEATETHRATEGTESSVSATASTVWDELEDLKSRINRLELTGKLPTTSGAAISRASHERPPTATTTATTMSFSPKRGRGNSVSPIDTTAVDPQTSDAHPLLRAALAKSKTLLAPEIYSSLEAAASDALSFAAMVGSSSQPGPISSSQSTIGGGSSSISERQLRRKADSMCRSLTELCLALTEGKTDQTLQNVDKPRSRDTEAMQSIEAQRQPIMTDVSRVKSSPRALSRLEARRSSLLATSNLPSPRYAPSDAGTPTQSSMTGRRTSLLLRSRRAGTEEPEEEDESRFRAPSRATTEIGRIKGSPREYALQPPLPDRGPSVQSSLPVRRHYASSGLPNAGPAALPVVSNITGRRYLDRSTPERDTASTVSRITERKPSISQGFTLGRIGSLTRRTRDPQSTGYQ
ncbi:hypothetical protein BJ878DRAFT_414483 [Calycina marina]|uniref:LPXTG-motif cell wall anchor domain protein n=1 Tax=Calycina marina TaxID=1763456 RepID=A0A9P7Z9I8_9HELO|nr:hypothetical protein BJ878DRAFT_414483 [Calycina marina]